MKPRNGNSSGPDIQGPEPSQTFDWVDISKEDMLDAERKVAAHMTSSLAIWAVSLEVYQSMVHDWTSARQEALRKSMTVMLKGQSDQLTEGKADQAAGALMEQWSTFQRDFLALQMKTAAKANALLQKVTEIAKNPNMGSDSGHETWNPATGSFMHVPTEPPSDK